MTGEKQKDFDDNIHVIPTGETEHDETEACWCSPYWDRANQIECEQGIANRKVIVHRRIKDLLQ